MTLFRNTTWLIGGRLVGDALALVFYLVLARRFGEAGIGDYAFAFSMAALFGLGVEFGLRPLLTRRVARRPGRAAAYAGTVLAVQLGLVAALALGLGVLVGIAGYTVRVSVLLFLAYAGLGLRAAGLSFVSYLEGVEAMDRSAQLEVLYRATTALLGLGLIAAGATLTGVMTAHVAGGAIYLGMSAWLARRRFGRLRLRVDSRLARRLLAAALPFVGAALLYELYARVDILMLHHLAGQVETGRYAVAVRVISALTVVASLTGVAMYPGLSREGDGQKDERRSVFLPTLKWLSLLGMAGVVALLSAGDGMLVFLFGDEFARSGELLRWLVVIFFAEFARVPYWRLLFAVNRERTVLGYQGLSVGLNIGLNVLLIPRWGALGAVWASTASEILLAGVYHFSCVRIVEADYARKGARLAIAGGVGIAAGLVLRDLMPWPVALIVAPAVFAVAAIATRLVTRRDYARLRASLRRQESLARP